MKTEVIPNQYDGPRKPGKRLEGGCFNLDYADSDDAAEIDTGIRVRGNRVYIGDRLALPWMRNWTPKPGPVWRGT
jgi:hypothetical protein